MILNIKSNWSCKETLKYCITLSLYHYQKLTLEDVVTAKFGNVWVMGDEVVKEVRELVALA